jgi:hypothetical protein
MSAKAAVVEPKAVTQQQHETHTIRLCFDHVGLRVDVTVVKSSGPSVEAAYQKAVELKGEATVRQIRKAVESVESDPAKQAAMLLKAVGA